MGQASVVERCVEVLGCRHGFLPCTYLGMPLRVTFKNKAPWNPVVERVHKRLSGWKGMLLSKGGKMTMIKSVLASLPTYFMSLFVISSSMASEIEKCQRRFLWGKGKDSVGMNSVA